MHSILNMVAYARDVTLVFHDLERFSSRILETLSSTANLGDIAKP